MNIAEGNGKRAGNERNRYFEIARGSAMEAAATLDILVSICVKRLEEVTEGKKMLIRIVSMLTKLAPPHRK